MKKVFTTFLLAFILALVSNMLLFGQNYTGQVFDAKTKQPISYVAIGIIGKSIGTISDNNGLFQINISENFNNDTIIICILGYESVKFKCADFISKNGSSNNYFLKESVYTFPDVIIRTKKFVSEKVGNFGGEQGVAFSDESGVNFSDGDSLGASGCELGTYIEINQKLIFIDTIGFEIFENDFDSLLFRVNIYKGKGKQSLENLLKKPIYVTAKKGVHDVSIDIRQYSISVDGDFIIAVQLIDFPKDEKSKTVKKFGFKVGLKGMPLLARRNQFSDWHKLPLLKIAFYATISYEKK